MSIERKYLPCFDIKSEADGRVRKGIAAVFGNVDSGGDRIIPGAFSKTIKEGFKHVKHLWNHNYSELPTAAILELKEVARDDLPEAVLTYAPEASGGLMVAREYLDTPRGNEVLEALNKGAITEMSFAYETLQSNDVEEGEQKIRNLIELRLFDTSDVNWGMNGATVATGAKSLGHVVDELTALLAEFKAGRRNATKDESLINAIHMASYELGCTNCLGIKTEEPSEEDVDEGKEAGAVIVNNTPLFANRVALQKLQIELLR